MPRLPEREPVLVEPSLERLPSYSDALRRGWSPDTLRDDARFDELSAIAADPRAFVDAFNDPYREKPPIKLRDGRLVARLPGFRRWIWDGEFAGSIGLRWQPGTPALPPWCFGHIGYSVVAWKRGRGYATAALRLMLPEARAIGLPYVQITTTADNLASQRVIANNGGVFLDRFDVGGSHGVGQGLRYRIDLP